MSSIEESSFEGCLHLTSIVVGNGIESIGNNAFKTCPWLTDIYCYAENVPHTGSDLFAQSYIYYITLHVSAESINAYKAEYPWKDFGNIVALTDNDPSPTGIKSLKEDNYSYPVGTYSIDGKRLQKERRGLNIIRMNDGKTIKRIVK